MRVRQIIVEKLFRQYDHTIPLRLDQRVTVLHGRNGVGKTVTLRLIAGLLGGDGPESAADRLDELYEFPFARLRVEFVDGRQVEVRSVPMDGHLEVESSGGDQEPAVEKFPDMRIYDSALLRNPAMGPAQRLIRALIGDMPVHFVEAQRLFSLAQDSSMTPTVTGLATEMAAMIVEVDSAYRATSTRLDDTLPARLFSPANKSPAILPDELRRRTEALNRERQRLHDIGLLTNSTAAFDPNALDETQRAMFGIYLQDNEAKLAVFRRFADRAEILLRILNRKFAPKHVQLDKDRGYLVLSHDKQPLPIGCLSSGEQHEMVLLHNLLFRVAPSALLLIDEPELSLHVTWQSEFLDDLLQIAATVGFDAIVATHSPYIVGGHRDLMVQLGDPV